MRYCNFSILMIITGLMSTDIIGSQRPILPRQSVPFAERRVVVIVLAMVEYSLSSWLTASFKFIVSRALNVPGRSNLC